MLTMLAKLFNALNSEAAPWQIALAFAFALIAGLTPLLSLHNLLVLLLVFIIRVNLSAFFLGVAFFSLVAYLIDPFSIRLGELLLTESSLQAFWTDLYQSDFWRVTAFNNTLTLGGLLVSLVFFFPVFIASKMLVVTYRERFLSWVNKLKIVQMLKASKFYGIYQAIAD